VGSPGEWDDDMVWTMSVTERDGVYYMLYGGLAQKTGIWLQRTGLATSRDLIHWEKHASSPVAQADPRWYETRMGGDFRPGWRDPKTVLIGDRYYTTIASRAREGPFHRRGVVALFSSPDLIHWDVEPPLFAPCQYLELEVPQVFRLGRYYYLIASILEDRSQRYWIAEDFKGPYRTPPNNRLAPPGHTAGSVCDWQGHQAIYCWHYSQNDWPGIRNPEGHYIPAPLVIQQEPGGTLTNGSWPLWRKYRAGEGRLLAPDDFRPLCGNPAASREGAALQVEQGMEVWALGEPARDFLLQGDLTLQAPDGGLAFALDDETTGYFVQFLPGEHTVRLVKWLPGRMGDGRPWFHWEVVQEVPFTTSVDAMRVQLLVVGGEVELSIDGRVYLSEITRARADGFVGLYAVSGRVALRNASLTPMREPQHS
jgi:beta-fructofuranosidase